MTHTVADGHDGKPLDEAWRRWAVCATHPHPGWWTSDEPREQQQAIQICARCPVRDACLDAAIRYREKWGVWGGTTPNVRRDIRQGRISRSDAWSISDRWASTIVADTGRVCATDGCGRPAPPGRRICWRCKRLQAGPCAAGCGRRSEAASRFCWSCRRKAPS